MLELNDSKRQVTNAPGINFHDLTFPDEIKSTFPNSNRKSSNGSISFKISASHLRQGHEDILSQLIGFRQYMQFHLTALKI